MTLQKGQWWIVAGEGPWQVLQINTTGVMTTVQVGRKHGTAWVGIGSLVRLLDNAYLDTFEADASARGIAMPWLEDARAWCNSRNTVKD